MIALTECQAGECVRVVSFNTDCNKLIRKLSIFGVINGAKIRMVQKAATCVLDCEATEFAVDESIARAIMVEKLN